jgi:hypothetical protein
VIAPNIIKENDMLDILIYQRDASGLPAFLRDEDKLLYELGMWGDAEGSPLSVWKDYQEYIKQEKNNA